MSELLDRIQKEIRERLEASRAAVHEHERLEAALHALSGAGSRATRVVKSRARSTLGPSHSRRPSGSSHKSSNPAARSSREPTAPGRAKRAASAGAKSGAKASPGGATTGRRREPPRRDASGRGASVGAKKPRAAGAATGAAPARKRAARGANRDAVLRVIGERPGVTARELADASGVTGGTLYSLLRRLTQEGTLDRQQLPGGQTGYTLGASSASGDAAATTKGPSTT